MNINFTGIKDPKIYVCRKGSLLDANTLELDEKIQTIRMKCYLDNDSRSNELNEFKRVISQTPNLAEKLNKFSDKDCLQIDISPSNSPQNFGYSINFNGEEVNQWDKSIFGICTFLCSITRILLVNDVMMPKLQKYLRTMNIISDKIGKECLKYVK